MPVSCPATANRSWPSESISAARSPARVAVSYPSSGLPDSPVPRWSGATTVKSRASAGMISRQAYQVWGQPCTSSSGGPSPPVTTCWRRSPVSTCRLVNVVVNPSGRCGAPATEPGPSGAGRADDELMRISFHLSWWHNGGAAHAGRRHRWVFVGVTGGFLARGAGWSLPQLVVVHVLEGDLRERLVGRVTVDGHRERVGEVGGRGVDDGEVAKPGGRRIGDIDDEHGGARGAARLQAEPLVLVGGGRHGRAQAGALAVRRVLDLHRELAAVVRVHRGGDHPLRVEHRDRASQGDDEVAGGVGVAGGVHDRRLAGCRGALEYALDEAGAVQLVEDLDAGSAALRGRRAGGQRRCRAEAAGQDQSCRGGGHFA